MSLFDIDTLISNLRTERYARYITYDDIGLLERYLTKGYKNLIRSVAGEILAKIPVRVMRSDDWMNLKRLTNGCFPDQSVLPQTYTYGRQPEPPLTAKTKDGSTKKQARTRTFSAPAHRTVTRTATDLQSPVVKTIEMSNQSDLNEIKYYLKVLNIGMCEHKREYLDFVKNLNQFTPMYQELRQIATATDNLYEELQNRCDAVHACLVWFNCTIRFLIDSPDTQNVADIPHISYAAKLMNYETDLVDSTYNLTVYLWNLQRTKKSKKYDEPHFPADHIQYNERYIELEENYRQLVSSHGIQADCIRQLENEKTELSEKYLDLVSKREKQEAEKRTRESESNKEVGRLTAENRNYCRIVNHLKKENDNLKRRTGPYRNDLGWFEGNDHPIRHNKETRDILEHDVHQADTEKLKEKLKDLQERNSSLKNQIDTKCIQLKKAQKHSEMYEKNNEESQNKLEVAKEMIQDLEKELSELKARNLFTERGKTAEALQTQVNKLQSEKETLNNELEKSCRKLSEAAEKLKLLKQQKEDADKKFQNIDALTSRNSGDQIQQLKKEKADLETRLEEAIENVLKYKTAYNRVKAREESYKLSQDRLTDVPKSDKGLKTSTASRNGYQNTKRGARERVDSGSQYNENSSPSGHSGSEFQTKYRELEESYNKLQKVLEQKEQELETYKTERHEIDRRRMGSQTIHRENVHLTGTQRGSYERDYGHSETSTQLRILSEQQQREIQRLETELRQMQDKNVDLERRVNDDTQDYRYRYKSDTSSINLQRDIKEADDRNEDLQRQLMQKERDLDRSNSDLQNLERKNRELQERIGDLESERQEIQQSESQTRNLERERGTIQNDNEKLKQQLKDKQDEIERLKAELRQPLGDSDIEKRSTIEAQKSFKIHDSADILVNLQRNKRGAEERLRKEPSDGQISHTRTDTSHIEREKYLQDSNEQLQRKIQQQEREINNVKSELRQTESRYNDSRQSYSDLQRKHQRELDNVRDNLRQTERRNSDLQNRLDAADDDSSRLQRAEALVRTLQREKEQAEERISELEKEKREIEQTESKSRAVENEKGDRQNEIEQLKQQLKERQEEIERLKTELAQLQDGNDDLEKRSTIETQKSMKMPVSAGVVVGLKKSKKGAGERLRNIPGEEQPLQKSNTETSQLERETYLQASNERLQREVDRKGKEIDNLKSDLRRMERGKGDAQQSYSDLQRRYEKQLDSVKEDLRQTERRSRDLQQSNEQLQRQLKEQQYEIEKLKTELQQKLEENRDLEKRSYNETEESSRMKDSADLLVNLQKQKRGAVERIRKVPQEEQRLQRSEMHSGPSDRERNLQESNEQLQRTVETQQRELDDLRSEVSQLQRKNNDLRQSCSQLQDKEKEQQRQMESLRSELRQTERQNTDLQQRIKDADKDSSNKLKELELQNSYLQNEKREVEERLKKVQAERAQIQERETRSTYESSGNLQDGSRRQLELKQREIQKLKIEFKQLQDKNEDLQNRFSKVAAAQLTHDNPNIADLSDANRPTKLAEVFSELYDNEWTEAFTAMENDRDTEKDIVIKLREILLQCFDQCSDISSRQIEGIKALLLSPGNSASMLTGRRELTTEQSKTVTDLRKQTTASAIQAIKKEMTRRFRDSERFDEVKIFVEKCTELCWLMVVQSPPVFIDNRHKSGDHFDKDIFKAYTKAGNVIEYVVWPPVYLHRGGPLLCKGTAQGKR